MIGTGSDYIIFDLFISPLSKILTCAVLVNTHIQDAKTPLNICS
jgi:hypothetical protein